MRIELLQVPDCPHAPAARQLLRHCLARLGVSAQIEDRVGRYPSPTVLIDGHDVMGSPHETGAACRLDRPTADRVLAAMRASLAEAQRG